MAGNIVGLLLSWVLLWLIERQSILALGFTPIGKRLVQFLLGLFFTGIVCALLQFADAGMKHFYWRFNPEVSFAQILKSFWWNVNSVLFEELIFRGALLYIAIKRLGTTKGILFSAIAFGMYHWFSFGVFGNIFPMIFVFLITGCMGIAWAYAFAKTNSMALPIGFHLGWNFTFNSIFSKAFAPHPILMQVKTADYTELTGSASIINTLLQNLLPSLLVFIFVKLYFQFSSGKKVPYLQNTAQILMCNV